MVRVLYKEIVFFLVLFVYSGCLAQKKMDAKLPEWAKVSRTDPEYYQGVGYAPKVKKSMAHYEQAHKAALNALASEISVEIMASTTLVTVSADKSVQDDLSSIVRTRATADIDGYEKVDSYENKKGYWVYYRLSRKQYAQREAQKRKTAVEIATAYFQAGKQAQDKFDIKTAIIQYAKSLDAVKMYLDENVEIILDGLSINLISEAHNRIYFLLNNLELNVYSDEISCKMGQAVSAESLTCILSYQQKNIVNFPIAAVYSERAQNFTGSTDLQGRCGFKIPIVKSSKAQENVTFSIDKNSLLTQSAVDYAIRRWLLTTPTQERQVFINIQKPSVCILADERLLHTASADCVLATALQNLWRQKGYEVAKNSKQSDYQIVIKTDTQQQGRANGIYTAVLSGRIELKTKTGKMLYLKDLTNIKGTQLNYMAASEVAYNEVLKLIDSRIFREMEETIRK